MDLHVLISTQDRVFKLGSQPMDTEVSGVSDLRITVVGINKHHCFVNHRLRDAISQDRLVSRPDHLVPEEQLRSTRSNRSRKAGKL